MSICVMILMVNSVKKILISIQNNNIFFSYKTNNSSISNDLINTNIISNNELIFSDIYIKENSKILSSFIKELSIQYNTNKVIISKMELAPLVLELLKKATNLTEIEIKEDESLTYTVCELLILLNHIKNVNCYTPRVLQYRGLRKYNFPRFYLSFLMSSFSVLYLV